LSPRQFEPGDYVKLRLKRPETRGIIVDIHKNNVLKSKHADHINASYSDVYYVLVEGNSIEGPYFPDELSRLS